MNTSESAYIPKILWVGHAVGDDGSFHGNHRMTQSYGFRHFRMNFHIWNIRNWRTSPNPPSTTTQMRDSYNYKCTLPLSLLSLPSPSVPPDWVAYCSRPDPLPPTVSNCKEPTGECHCCTAHCPSEPRSQAFPPSSVQKRKHAESEGTGTNHALRLWRHNERARSRSQTILHNRKCLGTRQVGLRASWRQGIQCSLSVLAVWAAEAKMSFSLVSKQRKGFIGQPAPPGYVPGLGRG